MHPSPRDRFRRVDALFDAALDRAEGERAAFVESACEGDEDLRDEVLRLVRAHELSSDFLEDPAVKVARTRLPDGTPDPAPALAPRRAGAFRIVREIGHGGMGTVYLAEREDGHFDQRVALKLVRYDGGGVRRFLEERRILAMLEHPGIARILDGGVTAEGRPFFAMEFVDGTPIDRWSDERRLGVPQRLALFEKVCEAVEFAHRHLVVHRDLKPGNILVTPDGAVKLLDFGIARLLARDGAGPDAPTISAFAAMTPDYASPEQVRGEPVTTASDVYALGVLLYRLLTGAAPYDLAGLSPGGVERAVCEDEPPRPSATFAGPSAGGASGPGTRAANRSATPERLRRVLAGDLDVIVATAMRKDADQRYPSVSALREDLERYRRGRPVAARPQSVGYRLGKFVGRHRSGVAAAVVLAILLTSAGVRERTLRAAAEAETRKARAVEEYLVGVFDMADPFAPPDVEGADVTARDLVDRGAARVLEDLRDDPVVRADMLGVFGRVYTSLGLFDRAEPMLRRSLDERSALHGPRDPSVAEAMDRLGLVLTREDRLDEAEPLLRDALARRRELLAPDDPAVAESLDHLATLLQARNDLDGAESLFAEAVSIHRLNDDTPATTLATSINNLAVVTWMKGDFARADSLYRDVLAVRTLSLGESHPLTAQTLHNLAQANQMMGRVDEAETYFRRALEAKRKTLGDAHPSVTINLNNLGRLLALEGRYDEAEPLIREALALDRQIFGERHSYVAQSLGNLGLVLNGRGLFDEAEATYRDALAINREIFGDHHAYVALSFHDLGTTLLLRGEGQGAVPWFRGSVDRYESILGRDHPSTLTVTSNLARALLESGSTDEAERLYRSVLDRADSTQPQNMSVVMAARLGLGQSLTARGDAPGGRPYLESARAVARERYGPGDWRRAWADVALAECLGDLGERTAAETLLFEATATLAGNAGQVRLAERADRALRALRAGDGAPPG